MLNVIRKKILPSMGKKTSRQETNKTIFNEMTNDLEFWLIQNLRYVILNNLNLSKNKVEFKDCIHKYLVSVCAFRFTYLTVRKPPIVSSPEKPQSNANIENSLDQFSNPKENLN